MLMFSVDFSAVPMSFLHLHTSVWLRCARWFCVLAICSPNKRKRNQSKIDIDETSPCINGPAEQCPSSSMTTETNECNEVKLVHRLCVLALPSEYRRKKTRCRTGTDEPITVIKNQGERGKDACGDIKMADYSFATPKASSRNGQYRNGVMFRSGQKRRRRSMSTRRARNPASFAVLRASGAVISDHITARKTAASFYSVRSNQELRRSLRKSTSTDTSVPKLSSLSLPEDIDSVKCAVNILVVEPDRCYRVIGAEITLEISASNEWVLLVKKEGSTRYCIKAQSEIKPKTTNRFTHAAIWTGDNGWKLEFPVRKDWLVFKELYKVCGERNVVPTSPIVKIIPVPGAYEVSCPRDATRAPFVRPESYIKMGDTELSRALSRTTANYDMDSEDEEWLDEFNGEKGAESEALHGVSEEMFELMIDAFEKALYYSPENYDDEKPGADQCIDLASREVVEAVYSYWMKKRKQKRAPLLKVFQLNEPRRAQLIPKPILRKKRSLKRQSLQSIHFGRGKDRNALQAIAEDRNPAEEQTETLRVEEAKASATRTVEEAIKKRQRAQFLMENADMAVYRATMALRIAEAAAAAQVGESNEADAASHFLDWEEREKGSKPG